MWKQTTWFTKGLRPLLRTIAEVDCVQKQTTWFTKGLRPVWHDRGRDWRQSETNDLIYEGIATTYNNTNVKSKIETNDLIYEGIATSCTRFLVPYNVETNDLIYEGIATRLPWSLFSGGLLRNKRPDLRRDCDRNKPIYAVLHQRNKRPDLRRDCDVIFLPHCFTVTMKQTTWFTKGLRRLILRPLIFPASETNDLIYEGIATLAASGHLNRWAAKETNDLIYEGIATHTSAP